MGKIDKTHSRLLSYSRSGWLGTRDSFYNGTFGNWTASVDHWCAYRLSDHRDPSPSEVFCFIDEHEDSIDSGYFVTEQPPEVINDATTTFWFSLPADRHGKGCNLSFLDGHVEHWRWRGPKGKKEGTSPAERWGDLADHQKIQAHLPHDTLR